MNPPLPFEFQRSASPLALRHKMSAWPSPLKSPVPAICQLLLTIPRSWPVNPPCPFEFQIVSIAAGVPPENVSVAVAVEVARARDLPAIANDPEILACESAVPVRIPNWHAAVGVPPENVSVAVAVGSPVPAICQEVANTPET